MKKDLDLIQIKELLEIVIKKVEKLELFQNVTAGQLRIIKDQLSVINSKIDTHSASLANIESSIEAYSDMYKINQVNIERVDTRVSTIENNLDITPPEDLKVPHFSSK